MTKPPKIGFLGALKSTFAAFFGVQSEQQRKEDFAEGKPVHFILAGLVATLLFVLCIIIVVRLLLANTVV